MIDHHGECDTPVRTHIRAPLNRYSPPLRTTRAHLYRTELYERGGPFPPARLHRAMRSDKASLFCCESEIIASAIRVLPIKRHFSARESIISPETPISRELREAFQSLSLRRMICMYFAACVRVTCDRACMIDIPAWHTSYVRS